MSKFSLKQIDEDRYDKDGNCPSELGNFLIDGNDDQISIEGRFRVDLSQKTDKCLVWIRTKGIKGKSKSPNFRFPKKMMGTDFYRRQKLATWIVSHLFKDNMGEKEIENFMDNESLFEWENQWVDWGS